VESPAQGHAGFREGLAQSGYRGAVGFNPAKSEKQARTARLARAIKSGKVEGKAGGAAARMASSMSDEQLKDFSHVAGKKKRKKSKRKKLRGMGR
jgi:hypothetical protein